MTQTSSNEVHGAIAAANEKFMVTFSEGDAAGMAKLYTEIGQVLPPNSEIVTGKQALQGFWQALMDMGIKEAKLEIVEIEDHGDTAIEVSKYTLRGEEGKILIECWLGAKWGFYKFPLSPDRVRPKVPDELLWREVFPEVPMVTGKDISYLSGSNGKIALGFDLTSPLRAQLEEARHLLVAEQRRLAQSGVLPPLTVKASRENWRLCLRLLDAEAVQEQRDRRADTG